MKKKEKQENLRIDLFSQEKERISARAMGDLIAGEIGPLTICLCQSQLGEPDDTNNYLR